jgi:GDSL-like Lipase/Acylhydrolase family
MRVQRLWRGGVAGLVVAAVLAGVGVSAAPAQAQQECPPPNSHETCELEGFTDFFLSLQVGVTGPDQPAEGAVAEFVSAVLGALNSREQAIIAELNGLRVAEATAALRTAIGARNMLLYPDPVIQRQFVFQAAEAAYRAESFMVVSAADPEAVDELGRVGMAAYALYTTGTVATGETLPQPDADEELIIVLEEFLRFLELLIDILGGGDTADEASEARDALEEAVERIRNRDPGEGGPGSPVLEYVALGDSYASGSGIGHYTAPGPSDCHRSLLAYSGLLTGALTPTGQLLRPVNVACHDATFEDYAFPQPVRGIEGPQSTHLSRETTGLVTVSMSGNDLNFPQIVRDCLISLAGFCGVGEGNPLAPPDLLDAVRDRLTIMYTSILANIRPDGQLVILTYPNITPPSFPRDSPCWATSELLSEAELAMIDELAFQIRVMIEAAAVGLPRTQVVDMSDAFEGHEVCTNDPWANSLTWPLYDSFHPNAAGHREYARRIAQAVGLTGVIL